LAADTEMEMMFRLRNCGCPTAEFRCVDVLLCRDGRCRTVASARFSAGSTRRDHIVRGRSAAASRAWPPTTWCDTSSDSSATVRQYSHGKYATGSSPRDTAAPTLCPAYVTAAFIVFV